MSLTEIINMILSNKKDLIFVILSAIIPAVLTILLIRPLSALFKLIVRNIFRHRTSERNFKEKYFEWLINEYRHVTMVPSYYVSSANPGKSPELEDIYINLLLKGADSNAVEMPVSKVLDKGQKTVILGEAGVGKTTFLRYMCLVYARINATPDFLFRRKQRIIDKYKINNVVVPVLVNLSKFNYSIKNSEVVQDSLLKEMYEQLPALLQKIYPEGFFEKLLESGKCIVFLDGLDEISDSILRRSMSNLISTFSNSVSREVTWVVTSRPVGYKGNMHQHNFETAFVGELSPEQIKSFVIKWYSNFDRDNTRPSEEKNQEQSTNRALQLVGFLKTNRAFSPLSTKPMLLSLITMLHSMKLKLPKNRALIYKDCVELLLEKWDISRCIVNEFNTQVTIAQKLSIIMHVACWMHNSKLREIKRSQLQALIDEKTESMKISLSLSSDRLIDSLEERSGLIISRGITDTGEKLMAFTHLSFQEYLAALNLSSSGSSSSFFINKSNDSWWREAALFHITMLESKDAFSLMDKIYNLQDKTGITERTVFLGDCMVELGQTQAEPLFTRVADDLVYACSCTKKHFIQKDGLLAKDEFSGYLNYLVTFLKRLNEGQLNVINMLLNNRRGIWNAEEDRAAALDYITELDKKATVTTLDFKMVAFLTDRFGLKQALLSDAFFKINESLNLRKIVNECSTRLNSESMFASACKHGKWSNILSGDIQRELQGLIRPDPAYLEEGDSKTWKAGIFLSLFENRSFEDGRIKTTIASDFNKFDFSAYLNSVKDNNFKSALEAFGSIRGWLGWNPEQMGTIESFYTKYRAFAQKCFIVLLVLRLNEVQPDSENRYIIYKIYRSFLRDYVNFSDKPGQEGGFGYEPLDAVGLALIAKTLMRRVIHRLSCTEEKEADSDYVLFLLDCSSSKEPEITHYVFMQLQKIRGLDSAAARLCLEILEQREDINSICLLILLLSHPQQLSQDIQESIVRAVVPYLYSQDRFDYGYAVRDIAAHTLECLLTEETA